MGARMETQQVISFNYTLRNKEGEVLDQSPDGQPLEFITGMGFIIEGLEGGLAEMSAGESKDVIVRPELGYGFRDESQINVVSLSQLPVDEVKVGDFFQTGQDRQSPVVKVAKVDGDDITLDANHPLAGIDLFFSVELLTKREAEPSELEHQHVHSHGSEGGCCGGGGGESNGGGCGCSH